MVVVLSLIFLIKAGQCEYRLGSSGLLKWNWAQVRSLRKSVGPFVDFTPTYIPSTTSKYVLADFCI